jgi:hypothetical protein
MENISEQKLTELQDQYGEIVVVDTKLGQCAFRAYKRTEYDRYLSYLFDEKKRHKAAEILVRSTVVHPAAEQFNEMLEKAPGIVTTCISAVAELGGQTGEPEVKKYTKG